MYGVGSAAAFAAAGVLPAFAEEESAPAIVEAGQVGYEGVTVVCHLRAIPLPSASLTCMLPELACPFEKAMAKYYMTWNMEMHVRYS